MNNKTKFLKFGIAILLGTVAAGVLYAQLSIPTNIDNAVITIRQVNVVDNANNSIVTLSGGGSTPVQVQGGIQINGTASIGDKTSNKLNGQRSSILGGLNNQITGDNNIIGGNNNKINGSESVIPGGKDNRVYSNYSLAAGYLAIVNTNHNGTFIWSDSQGIPFQSTKANQFLIRAQNGVGINTGVTATGYNLTLQGSGIVYGNLKADNMIAGAYYYGAITSNDALYELELSQWDDAATTGDIYYNSGNVGVGLSVPTAQLHVNGTVRLQNIGTVTTYMTGLVIDANGYVRPRVFNNVAFNGYTETDPLVNVLGKTMTLNSCTNGQIAKWNGSAWACAADAGLTTESDPNVNNLGKTMALNSCTNGQVAKYNGTTWICSADAGLITESDPTAVKLTTDQTVAGIKTFSSTIVGSINGNAATATTLQTARTIAGVSFNGSANISIPFANLSSKPTTIAGYGITDAVDTSTAQTIGGVKTFSSTINGNAATATTLQTARTIAGISFNGSANISIPFANLSSKPTTIAGYGITDAVDTSTAQTIGGVKTFSSTIVGSINGNAATATTLQSARTIAGISFNGSANINIPFANLSSKPTTLAGYGITDAVDTSTAQTIGGVKTFSSTIVGSINGNAATATNLSTARTCSSGSSIRSLNTDGTVTCETDDNTVASETTIEGYIANDVTTNYVPYDNGTKLVDSNISYNGTNVGIGDTTPEEKLTVNGTGKITNIISYSIKSNGNLRLDSADLVPGPGLPGDIYMATDNAGNVGIGTTTPGQKLDVDGNIRLGGSASNYLYFNGGNGYLRNENVGSHLYFQTNGANTRMMIASGGNIGIADTSPEEKLTVVGTGKFSNLLVTNNVGVGTTNSMGRLSVSGPWDGPNLLSLATDGSTIPNRFYVTAGGDAYLIGYLGIGMTGFVDGAGLNVNGPTLLSGTVTIKGSVTATAFYYSSDITLKKDLTKITNPLEKIIALNGYYFTWKSDNTKDIGLVAQDVEKVFPDAVKTDKDGLKSVKYGNLIAPVIEAIKELYTKYLDQQDQISKLEQRIQMLEKMNEKK